MNSAAARFKKKLTDLLDRKVIRKVDLHRKTGLSQTTIYGYLDRGAAPDLNSLDKIAQALDCDPSDLIAPENPTFELPLDIKGKIEALHQQDKEWLFDLIRGALLLDDKSKHSILYQVQILTSSAPIAHQKNKAIK